MGPPDGHGKWRLPSCKRFKIQTLADLWFEELLQDIDRRLNDHAFQHTFLNSFNEFLVDELPGDVILRCWQAVTLKGKGWPKGEDGNYRIDREQVSLECLFLDSCIFIANLWCDKPPLKDPSRQRFAIQVNDNPPDKALKKSRRTKGGTSTGKFTKSNATFAQIEVNSYMDQGTDAADIFREAFYQSMIPEHLFDRQFLHHVYVDEK